MDLRDLLRLASAWLTEPGDAGWDPACDLAPAAGDGIVNLKDLAVLAKNWQVQ